MDLFTYDKSLNVELLCGVDEAGRGPLAGDVYAAAVILPPDADLPGLNDSKKLSTKKREALYDAIIAQAVSYCVATATPEEIDALNILNATFLAMTRAVEGLSVSPGFVLVDGNRRPPAIRYPCGCLVKGDATSAAVAAASILAKVERDRYMDKLAGEYPDYFFEKHKGYGTKEHYRAIAQNGVLPIHRKSFLKNLSEHTPPNAHAVGSAGEEAVGRYLEEHGYTVIERGYRSLYGEIDLIARNGAFLAFVEVKTRKPGAMVAPLEAVTPAKQKKIVRTALLYLSEVGMTLQPRFDVAEVTWDGSLREIRYLENAFVPAESEFAF